MLSLLIPEDCGFNIQEHLIEMGLVVRFLCSHLLRSLVEEEDPHMKVSLGSSDMGVSAHLQSSKTGTTRFFTSNTHSSVVLQVIEYFCVNIDMY